MKGEVWQSECRKYYCIQTGRFLQDCDVFTKDGQRQWVSLEDDVDPLPARCVVGWGNHTKRKPRGGYGRFIFDLSFVDNPPNAPRHKIYEPLKRYEILFNRKVSSYHIPAWLKVAQDKIL